MIKKSITITCRIQAQTLLSEDELIEIIGEDIYKEKKEKEPGGVFKAFVICHEGTASPRVIGVGVKKISWPVRAVQSAFNKISNGLKFYNKHNVDNSTGNREVFGHVVGKTLKIIDGKLSTIVVGHFASNKKSIAERSDRISMEAVWDFAERGKDWVAGKMRHVTGIALLSTEDNESPAFAMATAIASVQAFDGDNMEERKRPEMDPGAPTFRDLRRWINYLKVYPHQLFSPEEMLGKRIVSKTGTVSYIDGDHELQEYIEKTIIPSGEEAITERDERIAQLEKENMDLKSNITRIDAIPRIEEYGKSMQLPDRVINLAKANIERLDANGDIEKSIKEFLDLQIQEDERLTKLGYGQQPVETSRPAIGPGDAYDDEKNPFLPEDEQ